MNMSQGGANTGAILKSLLRGHPLPPSDVRIIDHPEPRIHHPSNVAQMLAALLGIGLTLLFAIYAHATSVGLSTDLRGVTEALHVIFAIPMNVFEGLVSVIVPVLVLTELAVQRQVRQVAEALVAALVAFALAYGVYWLLIEFAAGTALIRGLSVLADANTGLWSLTTPEFVAALTAMLVVAGPGSRRRTVRWSWRLLIVLLLVFVIVGLVSFPGAVLVVLLGALVGQAAQFVAGIPSERAYGTGLVTAIERAGFISRPVIVGVPVPDGVAGPDGVARPDGVTVPDGEVGSRRPAALIRIDELGQTVNPEKMGDEATDVVVATSSDSGATALARAAGTRVYALIDRAGNRYDVEVLDGDRQVLTLMQRLWRIFRLRGGVGPRAIVSLKAVAERTALLSLSATAAGVRTPRLLGVGMEADSAVLIMEHVPGAIALRDHALTDNGHLSHDAEAAIMADAWRQLQKAHAAGLAHRHLTNDVLLATGLDSQPKVWITGWDQGEIAASNLAKRLDLVQLLALFALWVGPDRALASAAANLSEKDLASLSPLLQTVALPPEIRQQVKAQKPLLADTRAALINRFPAADVPPQQITRFNLRTVVMLAISIIAVAVVITTINFAQIRDAMTTANPWWIAAAAGFALLTTVGGALTLVAFTPGNLPFGTTVLTQLAGSFVALATPAGLGPAALNLRFLNRQKIATSVAVAVVALTQVSQIVITVLLLILLTLATGTGGLITLPSTTILLTIAGVAAAVVLLMLIPPIRTWAWGKIAPTLQQLWPRLSAMISQPTRFAAGIGGNILMSASYVMAFYAALRAFGQVLNIGDVAVIYLVGNAVGALVPTPGGLVGVEGALIAGLTAGGLTVAIATSVTLLFRLATYWFRIPLGWLAMKYLERKNVI